MAKIKFIWSCFVLFFDILYSYAESKKYLELPKSGLSEVDLAYPTS